MPKKVTGKTPGQQQAEIKRKLAALPTRIGNLGVNHFKENIDTGGWEGQRWPKRKDNLPHPLLQKSRRLYRSIWWKSNRVPRHFRCHCDIIQDDEGPEQDVSKRKIPEVHPMFRSNPGVTGVAFSDKHPYFESIPEKQKKNIFIASEKLMPVREKKKNEQVSEAVKEARKILRLLVDKQYTTVEANDIGILREHKLVNRNKTDYPQLLEYGKFKAEQGHEVDILPEIHIKEPTRQKVLPNTKGASNPDHRINGEYWEFETPTKPLNKKKISKRINSGAKQADNVVVYLRNKLSKSQQYKIAKGRFNSKDHPQLQRIAFYYKNAETVWDKSKMK